MSCCGQKRESLAKPTPMRRDIAPATTPTPTRSMSFGNLNRDQPPLALAPDAPAARELPNVGFASIRLRYLARPPILVRGTTSGRSYRFSGEDPVQTVARADAPSLLASGHFRRET